MKIQVNDKELIIGKRVTIGAALGSVASVFAHFYPEHAPAIVSAVVPITFVLQLIIANYFGITERSE
jgi:hypothetical protein